MVDIFLEERESEPTVSGISAVCVSKLALWFSLSFFVSSGSAPIRFRSILHA